MSSNYRELAIQVKAGSERAIAQALTVVESSWKNSQELLQEFPQIKLAQSQIIGVTGPPGAGKSTLVDQLARDFHQSGKKVAVLAVDPSSPFSGGAILGDRVRMALAEEIPNLFIRSMATRGALGGLARAARDSTKVLEAAGFQTIIIETVGVGQAEVDIASIAHSVAVVLVPGLGDGVQALKAGILEIADIFVLNKSDRPGIDALEKDLKLAMSLVERKPDAWHVPVVRTVASEGTGIDHLCSKIQQHFEWQARTGQIIQRIQKGLESDLKHIVFECYWNSLNQKKIELILKQLCSSNISLGQAAQLIVEDK